MDAETPAPAADLAAENSLRIPNESAEHRGARNALLAEEIELRRHMHRAARALARCFDEAFRPLALTSRQFSLLNALNRSEPPNVKQLAALLSVDRRTLTAALNPLVRRGLTAPVAMNGDRRCRRTTLTAAGRCTLAEAIALWRATHIEVEARLSKSDLERFRDSLRAISTWD